MNSGKVTVELTADEMAAVEHYRWKKSYDAGFYAGVLAAYNRLLNDRESLRREGGDKERARVDAYFDAANAIRYIKPDCK
jgi:hypothetical protein